MNALQHLDRVVALAGVFQAASLVRQVARQGRADPEPFAATIDSLFRIDAASAEAVFGGRRALRLGLRTLCDQLERNSRRRDTDLTRYSVSLLFLERKLARRPDLLYALRQGVEAATAQARHFSTTHENVLARLADLYLHTISALPPRIVVTGNPAYLNDPDNANRIRSVLLAGVRAAVLWRQLGGSQLRLLLGRRRMVASAEVILAELEA